MTNDERATLGIALAELRGFRGEVRDEFRLIRDGLSDVVGRVVSLETTQAANAAIVIAQEARSVRVRSMHLFVVAMAGGIAGIVLKIITQ